MKHCSINGISVNYLPYGDAILIMESINEFNIMNGIINPFIQSKMVYSLGMVNSILLNLWITSKS